MIVASIKGFGPGPYEDGKVYENVAQCTGGVGIDHGLPRRSAAGHRRADGDSGTGLHLASASQAPRCFSAPVPAAARRSMWRCRTACSISAASSCATSNGSKLGPLKEYSQFGQNIPFGDATPRAGNDSGGGQPGWILKCKGWENDPQRLHLLHHAGAGMGADLRHHRRADLEDGSGIRHAAGAAAEADGDFRAHEGMDQDQDQVRGHGHLQHRSISRSVRSCR